MEVEQPRYFPPCIMTEILLRLPFKFLVRSKCVSKTWCSLISDSNFIISYIRSRNAGAQDFKLDRLGVARLSSSGEPSIFSKNFEGTLKEEILLDGNHAVKVDDKVHFRHGTSLPSFAQVVCSLDGLVVLSLNYDHKLFLWNPSVKNYKEMERHTCVLDDTRCVLWGIGKCDDDYKVVWICRTLGLTPGHDPDPTFAEFFSVKAGSWRDIPCRFSFLYTVYRDAQGVNVNGKPHWVVGGRTKSRKDQGSVATFVSDHSVTPKTKVILYFDPKSNQIGEIGLPSRLNHMDANFDLGVLAGCLCLAHNDTLESHFEILVMMEYGSKESWTKLFTFKDSFNSVVPINLTRKDEVLMEVDRNKFVIYSLEEEKIKTTLLWEDNEERFKVVAYAESSLSPLDFPSEPYPVGRVYFGVENMPEEYRTIAAYTLQQEPDFYDPQFYSSDDDNYYEGGNEMSSWEIGPDKEEEEVESDKKTSQESNKKKSQEANKKLNKKDGSGSSKEEEGDTSGFKFSNRFSLLDIE